MEKIKTSLIVVLAAACAWLAFGPAGARGPAPEDPVTVIAAAADIPQGAVIKEDMLVTRAVPRAWAQSDRYEVGAMTDLLIPVGLAAAVRIPKGDQVTRNCLSVSAKPAAASKAKDNKELSQEAYVEGLRRMQSADYSKAREEWNKAVKLDPANADAKAGLKRIDAITGGK